MLYTVYDTTKAVANCIGAGVAVLTAVIECAENLFGIGNNTEDNPIVLSVSTQQLCLALL